MSNDTGIYEEGFYSVGKTIVDVFNHNKELMKVIGNAKINLLKSAIMTYPLLFKLMLEYGVHAKFNHIRASNCLYKSPSAAPDT